MYAMSARRRRIAMGLVGTAAAVLWIATSGSTSGGDGDFRLRYTAADQVRRALATTTAYDTSQAETIPSFYGNYADVWETVIESDQPFFWYVPKGGGSTLAKIFSKCLHMVTCSSKGIEEGNELAVQEQDDGSSYLNVDPSTAEGLVRAKQLGVVSSGLAEVLLTHRLYDAVDPDLLGQGLGPLIDVNNKGRLFVMLRNPVKAATDTFFYRQRATWEPDFDPDLALMSLLEYSESDKLVTNYVVRSLLNHKSEDLTQADVDLAKAILRRKFLVGIMEWYERSVVRYEQYFDWWKDYDLMRNQTVNYCHFELISKGDHIGRYPQPENQDEANNKLVIRNWADIELYQYAKKLFNQQSVLVNVLVNPA